MCPYPLEVSDHNIKGPSHPDLNNHSNIPCKLSYKCANTRGFRESTHRGRVFFEVIRCHITSLK